MFDRIRKRFKKGDEGTRPERDPSGEIPSWEHAETSTGGDPDVGDRDGPVHLHTDPSQILTQWRWEALLEAARISAEEAQEERPAEAGEKPPAKGNSDYGAPPGQGDDVSACPHAETPPVPWPDPASQRAEERLQAKGIQLPWHYGDRFGEDYFRVVGLRAGGIGAVFLVESTRYGEKRLYAAKTLQRFLKEDYLSLPAPIQEKIALAFLEEALPWLEMGQHPGIVSVQLLNNIVHPETQRNIPFVFSRFMEQGSLKDRLGEKGGLGLKEALSLGLQLCEGLLHAYRPGLSAHRDLKPDNILVYREGIYQVTDFSAGVMGTWGYMAPEQVVAFWKDPRRGVKLVPEEIPIDHRADQFALAVILLEAFSGEHPFPIAREACAIPERAREFVERGVGEVPDGRVPGSFREVLARVLSPRPEGRFPELSAFREALLRVYRDELGPYQPPKIEIDDSSQWWFDRGLAFHRLGRPVSAEGPWKEALRKLRAIPGTEIEQAICLENLGAVYWRTGQFSQAEAHLKEALGIFRAIPGTEINQARCLLNLGAVYSDTGQFSQAGAHLKEALRILRAIPGTEIDQASCLGDLGVVYSDTSQFSQAEAHLKEALGMFRAIPGTEISQASCLMNLGNVYRSTGQFSWAEAHLREALGVLRAIPGTESSQASCLANLGNVYSDTGQFSQAEAHLKEALGILRAIPGTEIHQASCLMNQGPGYRSTGQFSQAEDLREALGIFRAIPGTEIHQAECLANLGTVYWSTGQFSQAEDHYREALGIFRAIPGTEIDQASCLLGLGNVYQSTGQFSQAEDHLRGALGILRAVPGTEISQASCLMNLGTVYRSTGQFSQAEDHLREALGVFRAIAGTEISQARCLGNLGTIYWSTGQFSQAEAHYREALGIFRAIPGTEISQARCLMNLGILYLATQRGPEARQAALEALEICERYPAGSGPIREACRQILEEVGK